MKSKIEDDKIYTSKSLTEEMNEQCFIYKIAILWVGRYPVRDFTMYIHRRASQRSGKLMTNYD